MKENKGITLINLVVYVVGFTVIIGIVTVIISFINTNIVQMNEATDRVAEYSKFNLAFVEEVKKIGADKVIAVRFKLNKTSRTIGLRSTLNKAIDIMFSKIEGEEVKKADYVIEIDTQDVNPFDFKQSNKCYKYGYLQAKKEIANIKKMIYKED